MFENLYEILKKISKNTICVFISSSSNTLYHSRKLSIWTTQGFTSDGSRSGDLSRSGAVVVIAHKKQSSWDLNQVGAFDIHRSRSSPVTHLYPGCYASTLSIQRKKRSKTRWFPDPPSVVQRSDFLFGARVKALESTSSRIEKQLECQSCPLSVEIIISLA